MTAANSNKKSFFLTRYLNSINGNKKQLIVNIVLEILGLPVISVIAIIMFYLESDSYTGSSLTINAIEDACMPFLIIGICTIAGSIFMGCIVALAHFQYLYKKTITDMHYSLPLSGTQRFFADYLAGLTVYVAPIVCAVLLSLIILGTGEIFTDMPELWKIMPFLLELAAIVIVAMIQYYTISVFALTFCGNTFEVNFSIFAFICMIPATIGCVWLAIIETSSFGIVDSSIFSKAIFTNTNPAGSFAFIVKFFTAYGNAYSNYLYNYLYYDDEGVAFSVVPMFLRWIFGTLAVTALYMLAAWQLHKHRKAEDVSKPYVYRSFFYAIMTMGVFCVLSLFITFEGFVLAGIVICAIVWFIMEVITRRGFKKFWTAFASFGLAVISVFAICWICDISDGFGMSKRLPFASNVESVTIYDGVDSEDIIYRDKDVIKAALDLNKEAIDRYYNYNDYSYNNVPDSSEYDYSRNDDLRINLTYTTFSGSITERTYIINTGMRSELTKAILLSDEYAEYSAQKIGYIKYKGVNADVPSYGLKIYDSLRYQYIETDVDKKRIDEIREAYLTDMKNMTEEDLLNGKVCCFVSDLWVLDSFENTIKALDINKDEPFSEESVKYSYVEIDTNPVYVSNLNSHMDNNSYLYYNNKYSKHYPLVFNDKITRVYQSTIYNYDDKDDIISVRASKDGVMDILRNCTPIVIGEMPIAEIYIDNYVFYLRDTPENRTLLENADLTNLRTNTKSKNYNKSGWDNDEELL